MNLRRVLLVATVGAVIILGMVMLSRNRRPPVAKLPDFASLMIEGRSAFQNADAAKAITAFEGAVRLVPTEPSAHLNLANAYLLAGESEKAITSSEEVLRLSKNSAAALYLIGCANLRLSQAEPALRALQQSHFIDPTVAAVSFQIGRAQQALGRHEEAAAAFRETIALEPEHPAAHYALSQALIRLKQPEPAREELARHQQIIAQRPNLPTDPTFYEKSRHTKARLPDVPPEQPSPEGVPVSFSDATTMLAGEAASGLRGPLGLIELKGLGAPSIIASTAEQGIAVLVNEGGRFGVVQEVLPGVAGERYRDCLVGDLDNDRLSDVVFLSERGSKVFQLTKDGALSDVTQTSGLGDLRASGGLLADLDITGKLGLVALDENGLVALRNQGNLVFRELPENKLLAGVSGPARDLTIADWNGDDLPDLFVTRDAGPAQLLLNQRGSPMKLAGPDAPKLQPNRSPGEEARPAPAAEWPSGTLVAVDDLNGDLRNDAVFAGATGLEVVFGGIAERAPIPIAPFSATRLKLLDYDNDGWLDIVAAGDGLRVWRNLGRAGFRETTASLRLAETVHGRVEDVAAADWDSDGDTDLAITTADRGLQLLRNEGGNANRQVKLRLKGTRSNASGLGARVELVAGGWRTTRTVRTNPLEIGVGAHTRLDSLSVHWSDILMNLGAVTADAKAPLEVKELELPTGSCPYLYAWDGKSFRYVTDLLGASPAGLRLSDDRFIDADTDEIVGIGDETNLQPKDGDYVLQITDELRELLFFDVVQLLVADHPEGTEVHSTSKLRPGKPFPPHQLVALSHRQALQRATRSDGEDVTALAAETDGSHVSPVKLRRPQLRGLAEPFSVTMDFGPLAADRPLVLALTGWLRFGGGMANVAASHDPELPFPFPQLEVETADGTWQPVDVVAGAPAGKTKSIIVELAGKLPQGARRLRLTTAFEIHLDRIALFERAADDLIRTTRLPPATADLHWRGTAEYEDWPWFLPITPIYDRLRSAAPWLATPAGWCTRYGDVLELLLKRDDALAIMNCGDEITLKFPAAELPPKPPGTTRHFFLYTSGWDKDGDPHVEAGDTVEPIPFQGMDDQHYGKQQRPVLDGDWWIPKYNTRWIGPVALSRKLEKEVR